MRWTTEPVARKGIVERDFQVEVDGRTVPGVLWTPDDRAPGRGPRPLVLMGHGATLDKRVGYIVALAHLLVRQKGFAAAAIDAPHHGQRRPDGPADEMRRFSDFITEWSRPGATDDMIAEWSAALQGLRSVEEVGPGPLGYWGLSMGTIYGIPYVASEPRVKAAVFGLMGLAGPTRDRMEADARAISCPVLFLQQWDDQLMPRPHVFELFDVLGPADKRLHAHPGAHAEVPAEELHFSVEFLARHLRPAE